MKQQNKETFFDPVCGRIKAVAAEKGLSNIELAGTADVSYRTIYSVMHGTARPRNRIVGRIAAALGVTAEYLLTGKGEKRAAPMMVREGMVYPETGETMHGPCTLDQAMKTISRQLGIPEADVRKGVAEWIAKKTHTEEVRSKVG
jgi:transcriptional regulator with XRE-family HTH domain